MANLATKAGVEGTQPLTIHTPLIELTKARDHPHAGSSSASTTRLTHELLRPRRRRAAPAAHCDSCLLRLQGLRRGRHRRSRAATSRTRRWPMTYAVKEIFYTLQGEGAQRRTARGVLPLRRLQPLDRARGGPRHARSASSATPTSSAPTAPAAASSRTADDLADAVADTWPRADGAQPAARRVHRRRAAAAARRRR